MTRKDEPSLATRKIELKKLIEFSKEQYFNPSLIQDYEKQLKEIENELKSRRKHRKALRVARNG